MTREQFISFCFVALLIFVVYQIVLIFSPFATSIFWAAILSFAFYPIYGQIRDRLRPYETLSAILGTALIFLLVLPPAIFIVVNITAQAIDLYQTASEYIRTGSLEKLIDQIRAFQFVQNIEAKVFEWEPLKRNAENWILTTSRSLINYFTGQIGTLTKNLFFVGLNIFLMAFLIFVFLLDGEKIYRFLYQITPLERQNKKEIYRQISDTFTAVIRGQLLTGLTQAIVAGIIFVLLDIPFAIFFAAATFFLALIPIAGPFMIWLPLVGYLILEQSYVRAGILFACGLLIISVIDNVMKPAIIGEKTKLPYFMLFFGILGGVKLYGILGIFLAPVVLSLFFVLVKIYREKYS